MAGTCISLDYILIVFMIFITCEVKSIYFLITYYVVT